MKIAPPPIIPMEFICRSALCLAPYRLQGDAVGIAWPASPHRANIPEFTINWRHWFLPQAGACYEIRIVIGSQLVRSEAG